VKGLGEPFARPLLGERQVRRQLAQLRRAPLQFDRAFLKRRADTPALRNVRDERDRLSTIGCGDVIQTDFDRKRRSVPPFTDEVDVRAHRPGTGRAEIGRPMPHVRVPQRGWHQPLDRLTDQFARAPAEHRFERMIRRHDRAPRIDHHDALFGGFQQQAELAIVFLVASRLEHLLGLTARGDVELEPGEPQDLSVGVAVGATPTLNP
jgi:hypothetical protein